MVEPIYRELGQRIQAARALREMTAEELACALSPPLTRAAISNMEHGHQRVYLHVAANIATVLDFPLSALLGLRVKAKGKR